MSDISQFGLRLALLFLPGIVCALTVENLVPTKDWSTARLALYSLVLGLVCYQVYALIFAVSFHTSPSSIHFFKSLGDDSPLDFAEIFGTTIVAPFVALAVSLALNRHWINRLAKFIRVSNKFGDLGVWSRLMNSTCVWVVVRDFDRDLAYEGWVEEFSDTYETNELLLRDVKVFESSSARLLYELDTVYLTRAKDDLTIELRRATEIDEPEQIG